MFKLAHFSFRWWCGRVIIVSALSLSLRDKEREREKKEIELDNMSLDTIHYLH